MPSSTIEPTKDDRSPARPTEAGWSSRTGADLSSLLLELARAIRGLAFYDQTDARRMPLLERAFRALESELTRAGAIDIRLEPEGFHLAGLPESIQASGALHDIAESLERHQLSRIRFDPTLTPTALHGLLELLSQPPARLGSAEQFVRTLAARDITGVRLNDLEIAEDEHPRSLDATPPHASASLGSVLLTSPPRSQREDRILEPGSERERRDEVGSLETHPLEAPASGDRGERMRARLIELDRSIDDEAYRRLAGEIVLWAEDLWSEGLWDDCYRALLVLADHAVGFGGRSEPQARAAAACFSKLASGERLHHLIDRATGHVPNAGVRAAQLLLQQGARAVPALFDRICTATDDAEIAALRSLVLMLGEASLPSLTAAIESTDDERARMAIRLAGEVQSPSVLPALLRAMRGPDPGRRLETIRALGLLPGAESKQALETALASDLDEIVVAATEALASSGGARAVPALLDVLDASLHASRPQVSRRLIDALGRIGDERAVPRLTAILERRPLLRRAHWHAIQLATVDALARLQTKDARRSLEHAALHAPGPVRARAAARLEMLDARS
jgi:HEAT repeat protein